MTRVYVLQEGSTYATVLGAYANWDAAKTAAYQEVPGVETMTWDASGPGSEQGVAEYTDGDSRLFTITETTLSD